MSNAAKNFDILANWFEHFTQLFW